MDYHIFGRGVYTVYMCMTSLEGEEAFFAKPSSRSDNNFYCALINRLSSVSTSDDMQATYCLSEEPNSFHLSPLNKFFKFIVSSSEQKKDSSNKLVNLTINCQEEYQDSSCESHCLYSSPALVPSISSVASSAPPVLFLPSPDLLSTSPDGLIYISGAAEQMEKTEECRSNRQKMTGSGTASMSTLKDFRENELTYENIHVCSNSTDSTNSNCSNCYSNKHVNSAYKNAQSKSICESDTQAVLYYNEYVTNPQNDELYCEEPCRDGCDKVLRKCEKLENVINNHCDDRTTTPVAPARQECSTASSSSSSFAVMNSALSSSGICRYFPLKNDFQSCSSCIDTGNKKIVKCFQVSSSPLKHDMDHKNIVCTLNDDKETGISSNDDKNKKVYFNPRNGVSNSFEEKTCSAVTMDVDDCNKVSVAAGGGVAYKRKQEDSFMLIDKTSCSDKETNLVVATSLCFSENVNFSDENDAVDINSNEFLDCANDECFFASSTSPKRNKSESNNLNLNALNFVKSASVEGDTDIVVHTDTDFDVHSAGTKNHKSYRDNFSNESVLSKKIEASTDCFRRAYSTSPLSTFAPNVNKFGIEKTGIENLCIDIRTSQAVCLFSRALHLLVATNKYTNYASLLECRKRAQMIFKKCDGCEHGTSPSSTATFQNNSNFSVTINKISGLHFLGEQCYSNLVNNSVPSDEAATGGVNNSLSLSPYRIHTANTNCNNNNESPFIDFADLTNNRNIYSSESQSHHLPNKQANYNMSWWRLLFNGNLYDPNVPPPSAFPCLSSCFEITSLQQRMMYEDTIKALGMIRPEWKKKDSGWPYWWHRCNLSSHYVSSFQKCADFNINYSDCKQNTRYQNSFHKEHMMLSVYRSILSSLFCAVGVNILLKKLPFEVIVRHLKQLDSIERPVLSVDDDCIYSYCSSSFVDQRPSNEFLCDFRPCDINNSDGNSNEGMERNNSNRTYTMNAYGNCMIDNALSELDQFAKNNMKAVSSSSAVSSTFAYPSFLTSDYTGSSQYFSPATTVSPTIVDPSLESKLYNNSKISTTSSPLSPSCNVSTRGLSRAISGTSVIDSAEDDTPLSLTRHLSVEEAVASEETLNTDLHKQNVEGVKSKNDKKLFSLRTRSLRSTPENYDASSKSIPSSLMAHSQSVVNAPENYDAFSKSIPSSLMSHSQSVGNAPENYDASSKSISSSLISHSQSVGNAEVELITGLTPGSKVRALRSIFTSNHCKSNESSRACLSPVDDPKQQMYIDAYISRVHRSVDHGTKISFRFSDPPQTSLMAASDLAGHVANGNIELLPVSPLSLTSASSICFPLPVKEELDPQKVLAASYASASRSRSTAGTAGFMNDGISGRLKKKFIGKHRPSPPGAEKHCKCKFSNARAELAAKLRNLIRTAPAQFKQCCANTPDLLNIQFQNARTYQLEILAYLMNIDPWKYAMNPHDKPSKSEQENIVAWYKAAINSAEYNKLVREWEHEQSLLKASATGIGIATTENANCVPGKLSNSNFPLSLVYNKNFSASSPLSTQLPHSSNFCTSHDQLNTPSFTQTYIQDRHYFIDHDSTTKQQKQAADTQNRLTTTKKIETSSCGAEERSRRQSDPFSSSFPSSSIQCFSSLVPGKLIRIWWNFKNGQRKTGSRKDSIINISRDKDKRVMCSGKDREHYLDAEIANANYSWCRGTVLSLEMNEEEVNNNVVIKIYNNCVLSGKLKSICNNSSPNDDYIIKKFTGKEAVDMLTHNEILMLESFIESENGDIKDNGVDELNSERSGLDSNGVGNSFNSNSNALSASSSARLSASSATAESGAFNIKHDEDNAIMEGTRLFTRRASSCCSADNQYTHPTTHNYKNCHANLINAVENSVLDENSFSKFSLRRHKQLKDEEFEKCSQVLSIDNELDDSLNNEILSLCKNNVKRINNNCGYEKKLQHYVDDVKANTSNSAAYTASVAFAKKTESAFSTQKFQNPPGANTAAPYFSNLEQVSLQDAERADCSSYWGNFRAQVKRRGRPPLKPFSVAPSPPLPPSPILYGSSSVEVVFHAGKGRPRTDGRQKTGYWEVTGNENETVVYRKKLHVKDFEGSKELALKAAEKEKENITTLLVQRSSFVSSSIPFSSAKTVGSTSRSALRTS